MYYLLLACKCSSKIYFFVILQIPFYPVVKKDLTFIHLGNDSKIEGLINFEKLRMIAKEVRGLSNMCSSPYDLLTMLELGGQPASNAMVALNQMTTAASQYQAQGILLFSMFLIDHEF